jgi:hypothetical protein
MPPHLIQHFAVEAASLNKLTVDGLECTFGNMRSYSMHAIMKSLIFLLWASAKDF